MTNEELEAILADASKKVSGDIDWTEPTPGAAWVKFRADIESSEGWPLAAVGTYNRIDPKLSLSIVHPGVQGRIYALDIGGSHREGTEVIEATHKHRWRESGLEMYLPSDITAGPEDLRLAWRQFCEEARMQHEGTLNDPPSRQESLWS